MQALFLVGLYNTNHK